MNREHMIRLTKELTDQGKLIEAGWIGFRAVAMPVAASDKRVDQMRDCFFAGAQHLLASILSVLDPDEEPTDDDLQRMDQIDNELKTFLAAFKKKHGIKDRE